jgi:hypothetical protein
MADTSTSARASYAPEEPKANLASNILAIVGFIILIVVVIWGLVHLASLSRGWFSSLFGGNSAAIEVTAPEAVVSGNPFTVSWEYEEPGEGTYAFLYPCQSGLQFQTPALSGNVMNGIPCGAAFTVPGEEKRISVLPLLSGNQAIDVPLSIIFTPSATVSTSSEQAGTQAQGSATVNISPASVPAPSPSPVGGTPPPAPAPAPVPVPIPTPTPAPQIPPAAPATPSDLSVRIISASIDASGQGVVTFDIANVGGSRSGTYYFTAQLPTGTGYVYSSPAQTPLAPGAYMRNTLRFSGAAGGVASVSITTADVNGGNNHTSQNVNSTYYGPSSYNQPYNYSYPSYQEQYPAAYYPYMNQQPYNYPYGNYIQQHPYSTYYPYAY